MRFLIDMPLSPSLADWLVEQGHDAVHATNVGLALVEDTEIIERAKEENRTVITADLDYPRLLALAEASEPSLILFRGGEWSERAVIERMEQILALTIDDDMGNTILTVSPQQIRDFIGFSKVFPAAPAKHQKFWKPRYMATFLTKLLRKHVTIRYGKRCKIPLSARMPVRRTHYTFSIKLSTTRFSPEFSKSIVSLSPSISVTAP